MKNPKITLFALTAFFTVGVSSPAYAYIDPGTGSMLLQLMLGGVAGLLVVGKLYFHKITSLFRPNNGSNEVDIDGNQDDNDQK